MEEEKQKLKSNSEGINGNRNIFLLNKDDISYFLITKDIDEAYESFIKEKGLENLNKEEIKVVPIFDNNVYYIKLNEGDKRNEINATKKHT